MAVPDDHTVPHNEVLIIENGLKKECLSSDGQMIQCLQCFAEKRTDVAVGIGDSRSWIIVLAHNEGLITENGLKKECLSSDGRMIQCFADQTSRIRYSCYCPPCDQKCGCDV